MLNGVASIAMATVTLATSHHGPPFVDTPLHIASPSLALHPISDSPLLSFAAPLKMLASMWNDRTKLFSKVKRQSSIISLAASSITRKGARRTPSTVSMCTTTTDTTIIATRQPTPEDTSRKNEAPDSGKGRSDSEDVDVCMVDVADAQGGSSGYTTPELDAETQGTAQREPQMHHFLLSPALVRLDRKVKDLQRYLDAKYDLARQLERQVLALQDARDREGIERENFEAKCMEVMAEKNYETVCARSRANAFEQQYIENEKELRRCTALLKTKTEELRCAREKVENLEELNESRRRELQVAQAFMTTAGKWSVSDVSAKVENLNEEIRSCAFNVGDAVATARRKNREEGFEMNERAQRRLREDARLMADRWGEEVVDYMLGELDEGETTLFEALVQNVLVERCDEIIRAFWYGNPEVDAALAEIWEGVSDTNDAAIAKTWLAMTHSHLKRHQPDDSPVIRNLHQLLDVSGVRHREKEGARVAAMLRERVKEFTHRILEIKELSVEGVLGEEVQAFCHEGGLLYDPLTMEDAYGTGGPRECERTEERIVGSTALGVLQVVRVRDGGRVTKVCLRPTVLLASTFASSL
ncbi:hypothetical protein DFP72DRAFT_456219 [Ephemerocybe angulata]|uniref:Uncharacterized protein n=1 Tax=Ephemerocybe angulata TaxID=980116 RepID=A0A8H6HSX6_9AGAR|nr:hypothetical protein DFP72DRAFT_456219 [Tulosesus angulatus]